MPEPLGRGADFLLTVARRLDDGGRHPRRRHVVVRKQEDARNGDIVVALVGDDESPTRRPSSGSSARAAAIRLQPENARSSRSTPTTCRSSARSWGCSGACMTVVALPGRSTRSSSRSRGASLECPVCGEFVLRLRGVLACPPECRSILADGRSIPEVALPSVARSRLTSERPRKRLEVSPRPQPPRLAPPLPREPAQTLRALQPSLYTPALHEFARVALSFLRDPKARMRPCT